MMNPRGFLVVALAALAVILCVSLQAAAQENAGVRIGVSGDPDQFVFGGHLETSPLLDRLVFRPNAEIGIGSDLVVIGLNFEFAYKIPLDDKSWTPYLGGGPALNVIDRSDSRPGRDGTDVEGGFNIMVGVAHDGGLFGEFKVGALDSPDLKLLVGYSF